MKKGTKGLVLTILSAVFGVIALIGLALPFSMNTMSIGNVSNTESIKFGEWTKLLKDLKTLSTKSLGMLSFSKVLLILALIVMVCAVALLVVQLFVKMDVLRIVTKVLGILTVILMPVFFVAMFMGSVLYAAENFEGHIVYGAPYLGAMVLFFFGLLSGIFTLVANKKEKAAATAE